MPEEVQFLSPGQMFGAYEVVREIGRGGMGAVYLVRLPADGTQFAVKVMFPTAGNDSMSVRRFIREAEIAMTVIHPNLVRVHEVGRDPDTGLGYMVMDYVGGGSLRDLLLRRLMHKQGPLSPREALAVLRPIASALAAAEARGIVHRDIKPDNILFTDEGVPVLADLGVAKNAYGEESTLLTISNVIVGTPAYMAPEQMTDSHGVDSRADVYSLGIVLWEMLVGERPTAGASTGELMARAVRRERIADITTRLPRLPRLVAELVRGMTEPYPEKRIAGPAAVLVFIDEWNKRERQRLRRWLVATIACGVLVLAAVCTAGIWYAKRELSEFRSGIGGSVAPADAGAPAESVAPAEEGGITADDVSDAVEDLFGGK